MKCCQIIILYSFYIRNCVIRNNCFLNSKRLMKTFVNLAWQVVSIKTCCHDSGKYLCTKRVVLHRLRRMFPVISVLTDYKWRSYLLPDLVAGLTVGIMNMTYISQGQIQ
jgi:hypothetical protein